jgi:hypothetical protein
VYSFHTKTKLYYRGLSAPQSFSMKESPGIKTATIYKNLHLLLVHCTVRALLAASLQGICSLNFRENFKKVKKTILQQLPYNYLFPMHWEALFTSHSIVYSKNIISLLLYLFLFLLLIKVKVTK